MKRIYFFTLVFMLSILSCRTTVTENPAQPSVKTQNPDGDIVQLVQKMTLRQKIGQIMLVNFRYCRISEAESNFSQATDFENFDGKIVKVVPLDRANATVREAIKNYHIGSIILFAENMQNTGNALKMISEMQRTAKENDDIPLIIGIDQEGGRVNRIFQTAIFPPAKKIGDTKNTQFAFREGQCIAEQLDAFGINLDFAPVCDVFSNPKNLVIGDRSFSSNPETAGRFASSFKDGLKSKNVIACAKHFPGHGDTATDSHIGLPQIKKTKAQWLSCEAIPFKINIEQNVPMIMSAHIQYPSLDSSKIKADKTGQFITRPATLSKKILTDILRGELQFKGVIVTDALDMKAISNNFSESQAVIEALNAGADLVCNPISIIQKSDIERLDDLYSKIEQAVKSNSLSEKRLDEAVFRVLKLKKEYGILDRTFNPVTAQDVKKAESTLKNPEYKKLSDEITTALSNSQNR
ncbi:MAG: glycoside hydrolase family 3 protein [Treponema sp.]